MVPGTTAVVDRARSSRTVDATGTLSSSTVESTRLLLLVSTSRWFSVLVATTRLSHLRFEIEVSSASLTVELFEKGVINHQNGVS
jgi:hypothetical protein